MEKKTKFRISQRIAIVAIIFWIAETWFFIISDGWHLEPRTEAEITCDWISQMLLAGAIIYFCSILYEMVKLYVNDNISLKQITDKPDSSSQSLTIAWERATIEAFIAYCNKYNKFPLIDTKETIDEFFEKDNISLK